MGSRWVDLALIAGFALASGWRPRWVPYLATLGIMFQTQSVHWSSDVDTLAGITLGLAARAAWERRMPRLIQPWSSLWVFVGLNAVVALSFLANLHTSYRGEVWLSTQHFLAISGLVVAIIYLAPEEARLPRSWLTPVGLVAAALAASRLLEVAGLELRPAAARFGLAILGDTADSASWNLYALFLSVGMVSLLAKALSRESRPLSGGLHYGLAALTAVGLASALSRTAAVIVAVQLSVIFLVTRSWLRRGAVVALAGAFVLASITPAFALNNKPVLVKPWTPSGDPAPVATTVVVPPDPGQDIEPVPPIKSTPRPKPSPRPRPALPSTNPDWRSVLDRTHYRLEQRIDAAAYDRPDNYVAFMVKAAGGAADPPVTTLAVQLNGKTVTSLTPNQVGPFWRWIEVGIPKSMIGAGGPATVTLFVTGQPDSASNFFLVGGLNAYGSGYTSRFYTGTAWTTEALSSDPGVHQGIVMVFLNGEMPPLSTFTPANSSVVDPSIRDRLYLWRTAAAIFLSHPLLGTGLYSFAAVKGAYQQAGTVFALYVNTHSNYMEMLSDLGLAGGALFALLLLLPIWYTLRRLRTQRTDLWVGAELAVFAAFALSSLDQTWIADSRIYVSCWILALLVILQLRSRPAPAASAPTPAAAESESRPAQPAASPAPAARHTAGAARSRPGPGPGRAG
jgi:small basic protein